MTHKRLNLVLLAILIFVLGMCADRAWHPGCDKFPGFNGRTTIYECGPAAYRE